TAFYHDQRPWNEPRNAPAPGAGHLPVTQGDHPPRGTGRRVIAESVARARQEALVGLPGPGSGQTGSHRGGRVAVLGSGGSGVRANRVTKFALEGLSEAAAVEVAPFGIKVLIVEPGAFRTGLHRTGTRQETAAISAYTDIIGPIRAQQAAFDGKQPGDPAKAAAAIITALSADTTPLRLPLGNDAADAIAASLNTTRAELAAWEQVTRGTDFDP